MIGADAVRELGHAMYMYKHGKKQTAADIAEEARQTAELLAAAMGAHARSPDPKPPKDPVGTPGSSESHIDYASMNQMLKHRIDAELPRLPES